MRDEAESTMSLRGSDIGQWAQAGGDLARTPSAAVAGLRKAAGAGRRDARSKLWQGFYLAEATLLYRELRRRGVRHVHAHFANVASDVARLVVALGRAEDGPNAGWRWSFTMHGPTEFSEISAHDLPAKVVDADGVSCISDFCRSQLMRLVDPAHWSKLRVVRMGVDPTRYTPPVDGRVRAAGEALRVLSVGRLVPEKGAPVLVEALAQLVSQGVLVEARIVGAGPLKERLEAMISERGLSNQVTLTGPIGQDELPDVYRWADVFVLPSFQEGLPVVLMEALATECAVVTTQIAGIGELVVDGVTGHLLPAGRVDLLAEALAGLAEDPALRLRLGRAGRQAVLDEFTVETTGPAMSEFLSGVTEKAAE